ncbi:hypothetical protein B7494_g2780 [Chlorociboria aeruginascens]|nr:hypothetical protein B7494_g2780 [Chlorociboria aeruginascens]
MSKLDTVRMNAEAWKEHLDIFLQSKGVSEPVNNLIAEQAEYYQGIAHACKACFDQAFTSTLSQPDDNLPAPFPTASDPDCSKKISCADSLSAPTKRFLGSSSANTNTQRKQNCSRQNVKDFKLNIVKSWLVQRQLVLCHRRTCVAIGLKNGYRTYHFQGTHQGHVRAGGNGLVTRKSKGQTYITESSSKLEIHDHDLPMGVAEDL